MVICSLLGEKFYSDKISAKPEKCTAKILCLERLGFNFFAKTSKAGGAEQNSGKKFTAPASLSQMVRGAS